MNNLNAELSTWIRHDDDVGQPSTTRWRDVLAVLPPSPDDWRQHWCLAVSTWTEPRPHLLWTNSDELLMAMNVSMIFEAPREAMVAAGGMAPAVEVKEVAATPPKRGRGRPRK
jgi:hypothetical protein